MLKRRLGCLPGPSYHPSENSSSGNINNVIAVAGTWGQDQKGPNTSYGSYLCVSAPDAAHSTWYDPNDAYQPNGLIHDYYWQTGTSFAAPLVSGLAGLILSVRPDLIRTDPEQVRNIISSTADRVGGYDYNYDPNHPNKSLELGYGRINAYAALSAALGQFRWVEFWNDERDSKDGQ